MSDDEFTFQDALDLNPRFNKKPKLQLSGQDGNGYFILFRAKSVLKKAKYSSAEIQEYEDEATSGDYDHLLQTTMKWFDVS